MRNADSRLFRLEQSVKQAVPPVDWTQTDAFCAMSPVDREKLQEFSARYSTHGLISFSDEELHEFELLVMPFAREEPDDEKL